MDFAAYLLLAGVLIGLGTLAAAALPARGLRVGLGAVVALAAVVDLTWLLAMAAIFPVANRLADEGSGFEILMRNLAQERLSMAVQAVAGAQQALRWTVDYCRSREAFGGPLTDLQFVRFELAELTTAAEVAQVVADDRRQGPEEHGRHQIAALARRVSTMPESTMRSPQP